MRFLTYYALLVLFLLFPTIGKATEGPWLVCDNPVYNFGHVDQSAVITNVFIIRNDGDLSFVLKYIQPSCSCTKGRLDKRIIGPGETARLTAVYTAARRHGKQRKRLCLVSYDTGAPALSVYIEGFVEAPDDFDKTDNHLLIKQKELKNGRNF